MSCFENRSFPPFAMAVALALGGCVTIAPTPEERALIEARAMADEARIREAFEAERAAETAARNSEVEAELQSRLPEGAALARKQARLQSEMLELVELYQTAGPAERSRLEARAQALAEEARALGQ